MIPKTVMEKAIAGGWRNGFLLSNPQADVKTLLREYKSFPAPWQEIVLDPSFWQCLGKALGWNKYVCEHCGGDFNPPETRHENHATCLRLGKCLGVWTGDWDKHAKYFYNLILTGDDTKAFWAAVLATKEE